jgi:hypothetical protein
MDRRIVSERVDGVFKVLLLLEKVVQAANPALKVLDAPHMCAGIWINPTFCP